MKSGWKIGPKGAGVVVFVGLAFILNVTGHAQLILNEANTIDEDVWLEASLIEEGGDTFPETGYEGFDYGVIPHSGNNNPPDGSNPGNPFPEDLELETTGNQTTLPNGWNGTTGFGRILGNGSDWFELVVTEDHTDLRGYTLYWENDDDENNVIGETPDERGFVKFTRHKAWANLRAGTIVTLSEYGEPADTAHTVHEIRDDFPYDFPETDPDDTGYDYDLSTDLSFEPFTTSDWHIHFHVDEEVTKGSEEVDPAATPYFEALSDVKGHNNDWQMAIFDATNTTLADEVEDTHVDRGDLDLTTGRVQGLIGEDVSNWGDNVPGGAGGVNSHEMLALVNDPESDRDASYYEDLDWSTFGAPNVFNAAKEGMPDEQDDNRLGGVQDFSALRDPVLDNTYDWVGGSTDFGTAGNWQNADTQATPGNGPASEWTVRLNGTGGAQVVDVSSDKSIAFGSVMATSGTMTLHVHSGATLSVATNVYDYNGDGIVGAADYTIWQDTRGSTVDLRADGDGDGTIDQDDDDQWKLHYGETAPSGAPGRLLVMDGGVLQVDGRVAADQVEAFDGGEVIGTGRIVADLWNSGGRVGPGGSVGTLSVTGDFHQDVDGIMEIELDGTGAGQYDVLRIGGDAIFDVVDMDKGSLEIALNYTPTINDSFTILTAASVVGDLELTGDAAGFELMVMSTSLLLKYVGGSGAFVSTVPEPASATLALTALFAWILIRRRR